MHADKFLTFQYLHDAVFIIFSRKQSSFSGMFSLLVASSETISYELDVSTQLNSKFNDKRPHRTHRAVWPLTYAQNETKKKIKQTCKIYGYTVTCQTATLFSSLLNVFKEGASTTE